MKGRTYRYMQNEALYPFGYGLNYGKVVIKDVVITRKVGVEINYEVIVKVVNEGNFETYDTIQVYIKDMESSFAVSNFNLCMFETIYLKSKQEVEVTLNVGEKAFQIVDEEGYRFVDSKYFKLFVGTFAPDQRSQELMGQKAIEKEIYL